MAEKMPKIIAIDLNEATLILSPWVPATPGVLPMHDPSHQLFTNKLEVSRLPGCEVSEPQAGMLNVSCFGMLIFQVPLANVKSITRDWVSQMPEIRMAYEASKERPKP